MPSNQLRAVRARIAKAYRLELPTWVSGVACVFGMGVALVANPYAGESERESYERTAREDWAAVGMDLWAATRQFDEEQRQEEQ